MSLPVRSPLDLGLNQLLSALVENLTADPGTATAGRVIYRTDLQVFKVGNGTTWDSFLLAGTRLDQLTAPAADVSMNGHKLTGLLDGTSAQDAVTKSQLDSVAAGLDPHQSVRAATTANITLSGAQTIDGVSIVAGDRVLVKNQTDPVENGIWVAASGAWARAGDANAAGELSGGSFTFIEEGTTNADTGWVVSTNGSITPGTTANAWTMFSGAGTITAGAGLGQTGSTFDVNVDNSSIEINSDTLRVKALGIVNAMIANGTIDLTAKVTGNLPVANGGTGSGTAAGARTNLGAAGGVAGNVTGDGSATALAFTHNMGTKDISCSVWEATTDTEVIVEKVKTSTNVVTLNFGVAPANGKVYRVVVFAVS